MCTVFLQHCISTHSSWTVKYQSHCSKFASVGSSRSRNWYRKIDSYLLYCRFFKLSCWFLIHCCRFRTCRPLKVSRAKPSNSVYLLWRWPFQRGKSQCVSISQRSSCCTCSCTRGIVLYDLKLSEPNCAQVDANCTFVLYHEDSLKVGPCAIFVFYVPVHIWYGAFQFCEWYSFDWYWVFGYLCTEVEYLFFPFFKVILLKFISLSWNFIVLE